MNEFLAAVIAEASALGLVWWERLALILALALFKVAGQKAFAGLWHAVASGKLTPPPLVVPSDGSAPGDPTGTQVPTDPRHPGGEGEGGSG